MIAKLKRSLWVGIAAVVALGALVVPVVTSAQQVSAVDYVIDGHKTRICHRTNSVTNPYTSNTVDIDSVDGNTGNDNGQGDHFMEHKGPLASSEAVAQSLKDAKIEWGDIIPPVAGHAGLNWTTVGQAMWANDCNYAKVATANVYTTPATCDQGEVLHWGAISNATFSGTPDGTVGAAPYAVTATANADALFMNSDATKQFNGTLAGKLPAQNTNPTGPCYVTVPDATAVVSTIPATCDAGEKLVWGAISNATFSGTANGTFGPASYDVTATATTGHTFAGGALTQNFNGTLAGQLTEGCGNEEPGVATAGVKILDATCETGETLVYTNVVNATATDESTPDGTVGGPKAYSVEFLANQGAAFAEGTETMFQGTLAGPDTGDDCVLGETTTTPTTPSTPTTTAAPAVLPATSGESTTAIVLGGSLLAVVLGFAGARRFLARSL